MSMQAKDAQVLQHIMVYCHEISCTVQELQITEVTLSDSFIQRNALSMPLMQIGELVKRLSDAFVQAHAGIPWRSIAGMRNRFAHEYGHMNVKSIWGTVVSDIPTLNQYIAKVLRDNGIDVPSESDL